MWMKGEKDGNLFSNVSKSTAIDRMGLPGKPLVTLYLLLLLGKMEKHGQNHFVSVLNLPQIYEIQICAVYSLD